MSEITVCIVGNKTNRIRLRQIDQNESSLKLELTAEGCFLFSKEKTVSLGELW